MIKNDSYCIRISNLFGNVIIIIIDLCYFYVVFYRIFVISLKNAHVYRYSIRLCSQFVLVFLSEIYCTLHIYELLLKIVYDPV